MLNLISADKILDASFETFVGRTHLFDVLGQRRFKSTGFEHWVQTEMIIALTDRNYSVTTERKVRKECDLIIDNSTYLEIRVATTSDARNKGRSWLIDSMEVHPGANMYLFVSPMTQELRNQLTSYCENHNISFKEKHLDETWSVMVASRISLY